MKVITTDDGSHSLYSEKYDESYHSSHGALQESRHVFIENGFNSKSKSKHPIRILEIGFGTGLNAYLTLIEAEKHQLKVHYTGIEAYPVPSDIISILNYPKIIKEHSFQHLFKAIHDAPWNDPSHISEHFDLTKEKKDFKDIIYTQEFDLVYFDAFAPDAQSELWEVPLLELIYKSMNKGGILVTYCAQGQFKRNLKKVGFSVEAIPGPPGKREITRAIV